MKKERPLLKLERSKTIKDEDVFDPSDFFYKKMIGQGAFGVVRECIESPTKFMKSVLNPEALNDPSSPIGRSPTKNPVKLNERGRSDSVV